MNGGKGRSERKAGSAAAADDALRSRIRKAAFGCFFNRGFSSTTMLEIATKAQISKRDLYARFSNKHEILQDCVRARTDQMRLSMAIQFVPSESRQAYETVLRRIGEKVLSSATRNEVVAIYRLTIAEFEKAPEIARLLDTVGREANHAAMSLLLAQGQTAGFVKAGPAEALAGLYFRVLWGDLLLRLVMGVRSPPSAGEISERAAQASACVLVS